MAMQGLGESRGSSLDAAGSYLDPLRFAEEVLERVGEG